MDQKSYGGVYVWGGFYFITPPLRDVSVTFFSKKKSGGIEQLKRDPEHMIMHPGHTLCHKLCTRKGVR